MMTENTKNYKKYCTRLGFICIVVLVWLHMPVLAGEKGVSVEEVDNGDTYVEQLEPREGDQLSTPAIMALDILPGAGHFYTGHYYHGVFFATLKVVGAYSLYYYWKYWDYRRSLYRSARDANRDMDPHHDLQFDDPDGGYKTVEEMRHEYDRAAHYFTLAVIGNVAVYVASAVFTWLHVREINENRLPVFDIQYSSATFNSTMDHRCAFSFTVRI